MTRLQVAIDTDDLPRAERQAHDALSVGAPIIEAGTLLIKRHGMGAVSALRRCSPSVRLVADLKTMDMGAREVYCAVAAGADEVVVCAAAPDDTIREAASEARRTGVTLMVSLIGVADAVARARQVEALVDGAVLIAHYGNDEPIDWAGGGVLRRLKLLLAAVEGPVAVGGSLRLDTINNLADLGLDRLIVGRALTESGDLERATAAFLARLKSSEQPRRA